MNIRLFKNLSAVSKGLFIECCRAVSVIITLVIITIFSLGVYIYQNFLDASSLKRKIEKIFYEDTGRKLNIKHAELFYSMFPKLRLKDIEIINAEKGGVIANIESCEITGNILSLFNQKAVFNVKIHNAYPRWNKKRLFFPMAEFGLQFDYGAGRNIVFSTDGVADFFANIGKSNMTGKILLNNDRLRINARSDVIDWQDFRPSDSNIFNPPLLIDVTFSADIKKNKIFNMAGNATDNARTLSVNKTDRFFSDKSLKDFFHKGYESVFDIKAKHAVYPNSNDIDWDNIAINYVNDGKSEKLQAGFVSAKQKFDINVYTDYQIVQFGVNASLSGFSYKSDNYRIKDTDILLAVSGKTKGNTMAELAANVNGHLFYNVNNAEILTKIPNMENFIKKEEYRGTRFSCLAVDVDFMNGRADIGNHAALESDDFNALFDGYIDLGNEYMDVGVLSMAKDTLIGTATDAVLPLSRLIGTFSDFKIESGQSVSAFLKPIGDKEKGLVSFISGNILSVNEKHPCRKIIDDRDRKKINAGQEKMFRLRRR